MIAGDAPMIFGDFDYLVIAGLGVNGLEIDEERFTLKGDASVDGNNLGLVSVQDVVMVTEQAA